MSKECLFGTKRTNGVFLRKEPSMLVLGVTIGEEFTGEISPEMLKKLAASGKALSFVFRPIKHEQSGRIRMGFEELAAIPDEKVVIISRRPVPTGLEVQPPETAEQRHARKEAKETARKLRTAMIQKMPR
jgi:hypothetical protein